MPVSETPRDDADALRGAVALLVAGFVARLGLALLLDPGLDEAYAMAVSGRWQLSWFDHPPMAFWWVAGMQALAAPLFGPEVPVAFLRLPFVLAFTATSWLLHDLTRVLWGARAALWALLALTVAPFFLVSAGSWLVPDGPLVLALALTARILVEILFRDPDPRRMALLWLAAGIGLGLAGLSKYHAALFALGALAFLVATPHRRRLATWAPWAGVALAVAVASPALIWNAENGWVSFLFQSARGGGRGWSLLGPLRAVLGQAAYLGPWTLIAAAAATWAALRRDRDRAGPAAFLTAVAAPSIVLFTLIPAFGGDGLPHWQMPGWLFLLPLLGRAIAENEHRFARPARAFAIAAATILALAAALIAGLRFAPPSAETIARLRLGGFLEESFTWRGLPEALAARGLVPATAAADPADRPVVVAFRWIEAARIGAALGSRATVMVFDADPRGFAFLADPAAHLGRDVVLIGRPRRFERGLAEVAPLFDHVEELPPIPVTLGSTVLFEARVAIGRHLRAPYPLPYPQRPAKDRD
ncbi:phospholipid carrier-dependent glycosyltransferase [Siculibacillus lacustris]|uniref:Phospholipid carrier-dependent glycosyltransferase n=1 Tax=Siculibacillus lacustris TaxID=1549641 RepID=A0A4Q9VQX1_9HYPH|nr:glycosyltransferase family 39 protein [Siculibacillus lacustris]TBW38240.1 phospholipid carrier-dependent glycosyltransferase [Siculibacillus lacustris]